MTRKQIGQHFKDWQYHSPNSETLKMQDIKYLLRMEKWDTLQETLHGLLTEN